MNAQVYNVHNMNVHQKEDSLTLEILETVASQDDLTQRHLANSLGVALGLANSYLKRCVRKGLIKVHQAPANRFLYYLTPKGLTEKSRLTAQYLSSSFDFYRKAGDSYRSVFEQAHARGLERILFCGISELTEIASLRIDEYGLEYVATYESEARIKEFLGKPVYNNLTQANGIDAYVLTSYVSLKDVYEELVELVDKETVLVPDILGFKV
jgi:DNA-binding MarR family transcriptional regulator